VGLVTNINRKILFTKLYSYSAPVDFGFGSPTEYLYKVSGLITILYFVVDTDVGRISIL
jgi:hypothetical protein